MGVGAVSIFTPNAVVLPPKPKAPIPLLLILVRISFSNPDRNLSLFFLSIGRRSACFAKRAALSKVPPIPMPKTKGGQAKLVLARPGFLMTQLP